MVIINYVPLLIQEKVRGGDYKIQLETRFILDLIDALKIRRVYVGNFLNLLP